MEGRRPVEGKTSGNACPGHRTGIGMHLEAASLRTGGAWAAQAPNFGRVRPSTGARCGKAARQDLCRGAGVTRSSTATSFHARVRIVKLDSSTWKCRPISSEGLSAGPPQGGCLRTTSLGKSIVCQLVPSL
jgi:hypothetical protein